MENKDLFRVTFIYINKNGSVYTDACHELFDEQSKAESFISDCVDSIMNENKEYKKTVSNNITAIFDTNNNPIASFAYCKVSLEGDIIRYRGTIIKRIDDSSYYDILDEENNNIITTKNTLYEAFMFIDALILSTRFININSFDNEDSL